MTWDYAETNPLAGAGGDIYGTVVSVSEVIEKQFNSSIAGFVNLESAVIQEYSTNKIVSTDPPYYDNIGYADLSDFFYIWLRRTLRAVYPAFFGTVSVPKSEELIAAPYRHGGRDAAEEFFLLNMTTAVHNLSVQTHKGCPTTVYYAFKQTETNGTEGRASTGWETFLDAVLLAGFSITGTWPIRTEQPKGLRAFQQNSLASSIVLVCRPRLTDATSATRRDLLNALKTELPIALAHLQRGNVAPVDLAQAAIGPGMAVFTRYEKVVDAEGKAVPVRDALALINQVLDEVLAEQEGDFDADSRFAIAWFEQVGFNDGQFGVADVLARAKNTSVEGLRQAGVLVSGGGKVRLLRPAELPADWDPETDPRLTVWEMVHHLIRLLEAGGETAAAGLAAKLGARAEVARELAYRLYTIAERKKRAADALSYNALVQSWPEIMRLAREQSGSATPPQAELAL